MKKRSILILVAAIVILGCVAIVLIVHEDLRHRCNKDQWKSIKEISDIADFFDAPITEMITVILRKQQWNYSQLKNS